MPDIVIRAQNAVWVVLSILSFRILLFIAVLLSLSVFYALHCILQKCILQLFCTFSLFLVSRVSIHVGYSAVIHFDVIACFISHFIVFSLLVTSIHSLGSFPWFSLLFLIVFVPATQDETASSEFKELYRSKVGSLQYLVKMTRPDIAYATKEVSKQCHNPSQADMRAVNRIFAYLKGTTGFQLKLEIGEAMQIQNFSCEFCRRFWI